MVKYALGFFEHEIVEEDLWTDTGRPAFLQPALAPLCLWKLHRYGWAQNSNDKNFPIGISFGSRVFVCDNLSFAGDHVIKRKHTANAKRDLPGLVAGVVEPLRNQRQHQARMFDAYRSTPLTLSQVNYAIMTCYRRGVINFTRIADVLEAYETPPHD